MNLQRQPRLLPRPLVKAPLPLRRVQQRSAGSAPWGWAASGAVLGVLLCLVVFAPARWLGTWLQQASGGRGVLQDARGTLWTGSARLTLTGGAGSQDAATLPGRLQWQLRPAFTGGMGMALALQLRADGYLAQPWTWRLAVGWGQVQLALSDSTSQWPAQLLSGLGTPWNTVNAQGQLALTTQAFALSWSAGRLQVAGSAQLDALDMSSRLSTLQPMGSYRFTLSGGATPGLVLSTLSGALRLSGQGEWVAGKLRFVGEASSAPESQAALSNLLNIIGRRDGARAIIKVG